MAGPSTPRSRARVAMLADIRRVALDQLAREGSSGLSLRAVARELGVVPSGLYRYYAGRDDLVTALVVDAYADLAAAVAGAGAQLPPTAYATRWVTGASAVRTWARHEPARFQLLYGSTVPGYAAPPETIGPAVAVLVAFLAPVADAVTGGSGGLHVPHGSDPLDALLMEQLKAVAAGLGVDVPPGLLAAAVGAWAEVVGLVVLELGGHLVGGFEPADALFAEAVRAQAERLGLPD